MGVENSHTCVRNGTVERTSRYSTFKAESHNPTPRLVTTVSSTKHGSHRILHVGQKCMYSTYIMSKAKASRKSMAPENTAAIGIARRGKYTFVTRLAFETRLFEDIVRPLEKKVQGVRAVSANKEYGMPSDGIFASLPKKTVKINMVNSGCRTAQATPSAVCL